LETSSDGYDPELVEKVMMAADFMGMDKLLDLITAVFAQLMRGKDTSQLKELLENSEEEQVSKEKIPTEVMKKVLSGLSSSELEIAGTTSDEMRDLVAQVIAERQTFLSHKGMITMIGSVSRCCGV